MRVRVDRGFTLIEMVAVVAIVAALVAMSLPMVELSARRAKEAELRQSLRILRKAIDDYKQASQDKLIATEATASGYPPSLAVLVQGVPDPRAIDNKRKYFLRRLPRDPFAPSSLPAELTWGLRSSESPPDAPSPGRDVFDVHSLSERRALDGSLYAQW